MYITLQKNIFHKLLFYINNVITNVINNIMRDILHQQNLVDSLLQDDYEIDPNFPFSLITLYLPQLSEESYEFIYENITDMTINSLNDEEDDDDECFKKISSSFEVSPEKKTD